MLFPAKLRITASSQSHFFETAAEASSIFPYKPHSFPYRSEGSPSMRRGPSPAQERGHFLFFLFYSFITFLTCYYNDFSSRRNQQVHRKDSDTVEFHHHTNMIYLTCDPGTVFLLHLAHRDYAHPKAPRVHEMPYPSLPTIMQINKYWSSAFMEH